MGLSIGVGRRYLMFSDPVTYQSGGCDPTGRPCRLYASEMALQTQWQSIKVASIPPLTTCGGPAA